MQILSTRRFPLTSWTSLAWLENLNWWQIFRNKLGYWQYLMLSFIRTSFNVIVETIRPILRIKYRDAFAWWQRLLLLMSTLYRTCELDDVRKTYWFVTSDISFSKLIFVIFPLFARYHEWMTTSSKTESSSSTKESIQGMKKVIVGWNDSVRSSLECAT